MNLPNLKGIKSEVDTANHIRNKAIQLFRRSCEIVTYKDMINNINRVYKVMIKQTDAKWWVARHYDVFNAEWPLSCVTRFGKHLGIYPKDDV